MYSTCLHCHGALGANVEIETFPVGSRLAFDARRGRLWVLCPRCRQWNLSPIEERWEAIECAERLFARTPTRITTDEIGLAVRPSGLELIRIGAPQRREFAAWRYGRQLQSRFRRAWFERGMRSLEESGELESFGTVMALGHPLFLLVGLPVFVAREVRREWRASARISGVFVGGESLEIRGRHLSSLKLTTSSNARWHLTLRHERGVAEVHGEAVLPMLGRLLPHLNDVGASAHQVAQAVTKIEHFGSATRLLDFVANAKTAGAPLARLIPYEQRLALEMVAHEESERRAFEGELAQLNAAWADAERVASIADNLLVPDRIRAFLKR